MAKYTIHKTEAYTVMSNNHFKEKDMSLKAKGLLSLMLSLPDEWDYSIAGLVTLSKDGNESVMNALNELETFGYLIRTRLVKENGQFAGYDYDIYETPNTEKPNTEKPNTEKPNTEKPNTEKPTQLITKELITKESITKEIGKSLKRFIPPTLDEVKAYCQERQNKVDAQRFVDYYTANGWQVGRNKMKDWRAAVRTWERNNFTTSAKTYGKTGVEISAKDDTEIIPGF